jgi:glutathione gamma-glutamylcysteinyltransferase
MAKYCAEDLPDLLKAESLDNVPTLLSSFICSLPANAGSLIKWVGSCDHLQENVLQQVHDTKLFMIVHDLQCARIQYCNRLSSSSEDSVTRIAASMCCHGVPMLSGNLASSDGFCCKATCFKGVQANGDGPKTVISGSVVSEGNEQGGGLLFPMSRCSTSPCDSNLGNEIIKYPSSADVLTILLLALHPSTWLGIINENLKAEFQTLVSTDNLPDVLKWEVCCYNPSMPLLLCPRKCTSFFSYANHVKFRDLDGELKFCLHQLPLQP